MFFILQYYEAEKELEDANRKLKDMTIVLEQRNDDITELRKQNRETSTKDSEKVNWKHFRGIQKMCIFPEVVRLTRVEDIGLLVMES